MESSWLHGFETDWMDINAVVTNMLIFQSAKGFKQSKATYNGLSGPRLPMMALKSSKTSLAHLGLLLTVCFKSTNLNDFKSVHTTKHECLTETILAQWMPLMTSLLL